MLREWYLLAAGSHILVQWSYEDLYLKSNPITG